MNFPRLNPLHQDTSDSYRIIASLLSIALQTAVFAEVLFFRNAMQVPDAWFEQYPVLALLSVFLSSFLIHPHKKIRIYVLLFFRFVLYAVTTAGLSANLEIRVLLLFSVLLETGMYYRFPANALLSLFVLAWTLVMHRDMRAWGQMLSSISGYQYVFIGTLSVCFIILIILIKEMEAGLTAGRKEVRELRLSVDRLADANLDFQDYAAGIGRESAINERVRISREIHDTAGYTLTNIVMLQEAALRFLEDKPEKLLETLLNTRKQAVDGLEEIRMSLRSLRQIAEEKQYGPHSIRTLVQSFSTATGLEISTEYGDMPARMDEKSEAAIYRLVQEGMTNSFRHGKATRIQIQFYILDSRLNIAILDNGAGSGEIIDGLGLKGMRERFAQLGGTIEAVSLESGFRLFATIPLGEVNAANQTDSGR